MSEKEPIKITIEDLDAEETPLVAEERGSKVGEVASATGQAVGQTGKKAAVAAGDLARKAWESDIRRKATDKAGDVTSRSAEIVRDKVADTVEQQAKATVAAVEARVREVDWKTEGQKAAVGGMRWLSRWLEELAEKFGRQDKNKDE